MFAPIKHVPLFKLLLPFSLGIVGASYFPQQINPQFILALGILATVVLGLLVYMKYKKFGSFLRVTLAVVVSLFMLSTGYFLTNLSILKFQSNHFEKSLTAGKTKLKIILTDELQEKAKSFKTDADVVAIVDSSGNQKKVTGKILLYFAKSASSLKYGDELLIDVHPQEIEKVTNPNAFNYKRYLFHHHIYHQAYVGDDAFVPLKNGSKYSLRRIAFDTRKYFLEVLKSAGFSGDEFAVASALLLGEKDHLSSSMARAYAGAGAMHVLAVSGLHVGIIFWIVNQLLSRFPNREYMRFIRASAVVIVVWGYALLTGLSPSVIRAATMFSTLAMAGAFRQQSNIYNTLAGSAFIILLWEPFMIMQVGMQLSYLAVLGIVYLQPKFAAFLQPKNWLLRKAWEITCVSVAAQIATAPLGLLYFHQFPNYFLISNLVVIPAAFAIVFTGVITFLVHWIPVINLISAKLLYGLTFLLNKAVGLLTALPFAITEGVDLSTLQTWGIYCAILCLSMFFAAKQAKWMLATIAILIGLMIYQVFERKEHLNQDFLTIYKTRGDWVFTHTSRLNASIAGTAEFTEDKDQMLFHVWHQLWKSGIDHVADLEPVYTNQDSAYSIYVINNKTLLHQTKPIQALPILPEVEWYLVSNESFIPNEWLKKQVPKEIILDGSWRAIKARKTEDWLKRQHFLTTNLHKTGGIVRSTL